MQSYSQDLRDRVLGALGRGERINDIARRLEVSRQWVYGVRDRLVEDSERGSRRQGGYRKSRLLGLQGVIEGWLQAEPGLTLQALCERLAERQQIEIKIPALWHQMNQWGLSLKKPCTPASKGERTCSRRARHGSPGKPALMLRGWCFWMVQGTALNGASTNMTRRYGWAAKGQRCVSAVPHGHWKTTTFLAARRQGGLTATAGGGRPDGWRHLSGLHPRLPVSHPETRRHRDC